MAPTFIEVAFPIPLNRGFHYRLPGGLQNGAAPAVGARVLAPFGKGKNLVGYVVGRTDETPAFPTKEILSSLDPQPFIDDKLLELAKWLSARYLCSLGEALASIVPPHLAPPKRTPKTPSSAVAPPEAAGGGHRKAPAAPLVLTAEQTAALGALMPAVDAKTYHAFLLRGITDSGKTEVYVRAIDRTLEQGRQALYLLPEIALTPPFFDRLKERYGAERVALWHSEVSGLERHRIWAGVRSGQIRVLLGARSAIFAPFANLGILVMDEEHEPTYKQEDRPRYHAREVALFRARQTDAVLVMGSATPSLEAYWGARQREFTLLEMASRVERRMLPPVTLIDRRPVPREPGKRGRGPVAPYLAIFSEPLKLAIEQCLARREQIMLFVNRRGFTPFLRCAACGWVARCSRCSTTLALHVKDESRIPAPGSRSRAKTRMEIEARSVPGTPPHPGPRTGFDGAPVPADSELRCHACLKQEPVPIQCPSCQGLRLRHYGIGTQRVEQELKKLFPFVRVARLDRDAAAKRHAHEKIYRAFANREIDVLVGTQMIAKGFDFPDVTLVGVVDADVSLHLPDFRSAERTFELIAQVAGRTGRGEARGKVLVQTHHPEHYALQTARAHDYLEFYRQEIAFREALKYPPYCRLVNVLLRSHREPAAQQAAEDLFAKLEKLGPGVDVLGPAPAPYARLRNQFRHQILLKGTDETLVPYLQFLRHYRSPKAFMSVDVDPYDLL